MACGVHLGIFLIFVVQAEHVCCLWASQAQNSQRQNGNAYVGFSQWNSGLGGSYPQNQLRQASVSPGSAQSGSLNTRTAVISGYGQGLSSSGHTQTVSQPAKSGYASVRLVQSSSVSKPNWQTSKLHRVNEQKSPKQFFGLSTAIASGSSVSKYDQKRTKPAQQDNPHTSKYQSSSYASAQGPSRASYSYKSTAQKAPAAAKTATYQSSSLFSSGAPVPNRSPVRTKTSASAPARRVTSRHGSEASKPSSFSSRQNQGTRNNPSQTGAGKPYRSKLFSVNAGNAQETYKPTSMSNMASSYGSYGRSPSVSDKQSVSTSFQPRGVAPSSQRLSYSRNPVQEAHNPPASRSSRAGTSGQRFAPSKVHNIPERYGGSPIRRLRDPDNQRAGSVRKPQQTYVSSLQQVARQSYVAPQQQPAPEKPWENKWQRIRMRPLLGQ
ncbi:hypothetical protein ABVT39_011863 [Epinephelus coioides]